MKWFGPGRGTATSLQAFSPFHQGRRGIPHVDALCKPGGQDGRRVGLWLLH